MTNLKKVQEESLRKMEEQINAIDTSTEHLKELENSLFSSKGMNQLELAKSKIEEQKRNPIRIYPVKKVDTRSVVSLNPQHLKLKEHLDEIMPIMIQRTNGAKGNVDFILSIMPGDPACFWSLPVNVVIAIPRGVVLHLKNNCQWVKIKHQEKTAQEKQHLPDLSLSTDIVVDSIVTEYNILDTKAL